MTLQLSRPITGILTSARSIIKEFGATHSSYGYGPTAHCFIGAVAEAEGVDVGRTRYGSDAYRYVIRACRDLLPGWNHASINGGSSDDTLPEAVLCRAYAEGATTEIALIVMTRAIKLAEADEAHAKAIADGRLADEAEMIAHAAEVGREIDDQIREDAGLLV